MFEKVKIQKKFILIDIIPKINFCFWIVNQRK